MPSSENFDPGRVRSARDRVYGIRMQLAPDDPMRLVLGDDWETTRWYATESEREQALARMRSQHRYSRAGDRPTLQYSLIDAGKPGAPQFPRKA